MFSFVHGSDSSTYFSDDGGASSALAQREVGVAATTLAGAQRHSTGRRDEGFEAQRHGMLVLQREKASHRISHILNHHIIIRKV